MKELEGLKQNYPQKRIEIWVDVELDENTIYLGAEEILHSKVLEQVNTIWMDFEAVPNMYEEVKIEFQNMDLFFQVIEKIYFVQNKTLQIEINLKLME